MRTAILSPSRLGHVALCGVFLLLVLLAAPALAVPTISTLAGGDLAMTAPMGVAVDGAGNRYITNRFNGVVSKVDAAGNVSRLAGTGIAGYSGDGGPASDAQLSSLLFFVAVDSANNVYIADTGNHVIRKVTAATGIITTVAGNNSAGYSGDGGLATAAQLNNPQGVAVDGAGNLYISDTSNSALRRVDAVSGIITTVSGNGVAGFQDGALSSTVAQLSGPAGVSVAANGDLYIADNGNQRIRKISGGTISTIAGNGTRAFGGDGGAATAAQFQWPSSVAVNGADVYVADRGNNRIRKISGGIISTFAGTGNAGSISDGGAATAVSVSNPRQLAIDGSGNLLIAESGNGVIRKVALSSGIIGTVVWWGGDNGPASRAQLNRPNSVAVDGSGNLYVADTNNHRIRKISAAGIVTTYAGSGSSGYSGDGAAAVMATLNAPNGVAVDGNGNLYIAECANNVVRKVTAAGLISTVAGNNSLGSGYSGDGGAATAAQLNCPNSVSVDVAGNLYIADKTNNVIRKVSVGGTISAVVGDGTQGYAGDGGPATSANLNLPAGVAVDGSGNLYIADTSNSVIRKVTAAGVISTVAGDYALGSGYGGDGAAAIAAQLFLPQAVLVGSDGNLYLADTGNNVIRKVDSASGIISTVAGDSVAGGGYNGDGGAATAAQLSNPGGLAMDGAGKLYIADTRNDRLRRVAEPAAAPVATYTPPAPTEVTIGPGSSAAVGGLPVVSLGGATVNVPKDSSGGKVVLQYADHIPATTLMLGDQPLSIVPFGGAAGFNMRAGCHQGKALLAAEMTGGYATFSAPGGVPFLLFDGNVVSAGGGGARLTVGIGRMALAGGSIVVTPECKGFASEALTAYAGEVVEKDAQGRLKVRVGSLSGNDGAVGDPLKAVDGLPVAVNLAGKLGRLGDTSPLEMLAAAFKQSSVTQNPDGSLGPLLRAVPVSIHIDAGRPDGVQGFEVAKNGLVVRLLPTLGDLAAFAAQVDQATGNSGGLVTVDGAGVLNIASGGKQYVGRAAVQASASRAANGFAADAQGNLLWIANATAQAIYPAFRYLDKVRTALTAIDAKATLSDNGDGSYAVTLNGQPFKLRPDYEILNILTFPAAHRNDAWWQEGGKVFINYGNVTAQGFGVQ